jgi:hypothetical protein
MTELWTGQSGVLIPTQAIEFFSPPQRPDRFWGNPDYHPISTKILGREG